MGGRKGYVLAIECKTPRWCPTRAQKEGATSWPWTQKLQCWNEEAQRWSPDPGEDLDPEEEDANRAGGEESSTDGASVGVFIE